MHIVIDARIRQASTGRPIDRLLEYLQDLDKTNTYTVLLKPADPWKPHSKRFKAAVCKYKIFSFNPLQQLTYAWQLYRLKPDLVHFTMTGQQPVFYFGKQMTFTHDLTMFTYVRAGRLPEWLHQLRMLGYRFLLWQSHRKAKVITVPTDYVRDALYKRHLFVGRKIVVTLEAAETAIEAPAEALKDARKPFIMHVGSPFPHKNIERLVAAFELVKIKQPNMQLVLAGKREYYFKQLEKSLVDNPHRDSIIIPGFVSEGELKWLYQNTEAYVLPSLSEGFGLPGLEAMVHGCPVVSSNATCLPEVYEDAAEYFDPNDTADMAAAALRVINSSKLRDQLTTEGFKQVKKFSWRRMSEQNLVVYQKLLDQ